MQENHVRTIQCMIISLGFIICSAIFSFGPLSNRGVNIKRVSVKGLAEREVDATVGIWQIDFSAADCDFEQVNNQISNQVKTVVDFLKKQGFTDNNVVCGIPELDIVYDNRDADGNKTKRFKSEYKSEMSITVYSSKVTLLYETVQKAHVLAQMGVQLTRRYNALRFLFTKLNDIKPSMLHEATFNAREAARTLTADSGVTLGGLRSAQQGTFSIEDTHIPTKKSVRVVTYMEYDIK